ncbi:LOW QUALITY PROTEIN: hypothetical protein RJ641_002160 [Dillenia turbinata]|uniref:Uncharacterized protein n=1 Tax=Dillenia turbinata TaxID=194707 RepID=A0AAN8ZBZ0_9MAGN
MELPESRQDMAEVERIQARLQESEACRQAEKEDTKAIRLAEMNRRNRVENFDNASELKRVNTSLKAGEAGYDPFSRRWTRSRNYYVSKPMEETETAANGDATASAGLNSNLVVVAAGLAATAAALEAAAGAGKLVDTIAPVD